MAVLEVSSRQFREKQKSFFELADNGEKIVIRRGRKQAYILTPIDNDDLYFSPKMVEKIKASIQEANEGKVTKVGTKEELLKHLDSL